MNLVVCFSGQIGSGKSSVSTVVADRLGWKRTGFGDCLRTKVQEMGECPESRPALQKLGQHWVNTDPEGFCRSVLDAGGFKLGDNLVIDGIRHSSIFLILEELVKPAFARLIFLQAHTTNRKTRVVTRGDNIDFDCANEHEVEAELRSVLPRVAHAVIDANQKYGDVIEECINVINAWKELTACQFKSSTD